MSLTDTVDSIVNTVIPRRGRPAIPRGAGTAHLVEQKLDLTKGKLDALIRQHPQLALTATLEEEPGEALAALRELEGQIADAEKAIETLNSALTAARAEDDRLRLAQQAALRRNEISSIKKYLARRDAAAATFSVHLERAIEAYRQMVDASRKAYGQAQPLLSGDVIAGYRLAPNELYRDAALEMLRLSVTFPRTIESKSEPKFPNDHPVASPLKRAGLEPLPDTLRRHTEDLIATLHGKEPSEN